MAITAALLAVFTASLSADLRSDATIGLQLEPPHLDPTSARQVPLIRCFMLMSMKV